MSEFSIAYSDRQHIVCLSENSLIPKSLVLPASAALPPPERNGEAPKVTLIFDDNAKWKFRLISTVPGRS